MVVLKDGRAERTHPPKRRVTNEIVLTDDRGTVVGKLRFQSCPECRTGRIRDVWIMDTWQRQGLGRGCIEDLLTRFPDLRWTTTLQTRAGQAFFTAMTEETSVPFPAGGPLCVHLTGTMTYLWRRATSRWRRPVQNETGQRVAHDPVTAR